MNSQNLKKTYKSTYNPNDSKGFFKSAKNMGIITKYVNKMLY